MAVPLPPSAADWWNLFSFFLYIGIAAAAIVIGAMVYLAIRNRSKDKQGTLESAAALSRSRAREAVIFASISAILLFSLAVGSYRMTIDIQNPPAASESLTINVTAFQWGFRFTYPENFTTVGDCNIPSGKPITFNVTSSDVMHNFGLPDFKLKIDAIPGRYNVVWITAPDVSRNDTLTYQIRCYELCGTGHTYMIGSLIVMSPAAFDQWVIQNTANMTGGM
jgi:cytochrome c oxidase subunit 2